MKKMLRLIIVPIVLAFSIAHTTQAQIQWVEIGEATYEHGFIFPYKIKLFVPFGEKHIADFKEGLLPMRFRLDWLPLELSQEKVRSVFLAQLKNNFNNAESYKLSIQIVENFLHKLPNVKKHDIWVFDYFPDSGTKIYIQDEEIYHIVGAEINRALLKSWLHKSPVLTSNLFNRLLKVK